MSEAPTLLGGASSLLTRLALRQLFNFRGCLVPPLILGAGALTLGIISIVVPGGSHIGSAGLPIWMVGFVVVIFSLWRLASVAIAYVKRRR